MAPYKDRDTVAAVERRQRIDLFRHPRLARVEIVQRPGVARLDLKSSVTEASQHSVGIEHRLLDILRREQTPRPLEKALALEVEAPGRRLVDVCVACIVEVQQLFHQLALEYGKVLRV